MARNIFNPPSDNISISYILSYYSPKKLKDESNKTNLFSINYIWFSLAETYSKSLIIIIIIINEQVTCLTEHQYEFCFFSLSAMVLTWQ